MQIAEGASLETRPWPFLPLVSRLLASGQSDAGNKIVVALDAGARFMVRPTGEMTDEQTAIRPQPALWTHRAVCKGGHPMWRAP